MAPIKIYSSAKSRGVIVQWYLKELGAGEDQVQTVDLNLKEKGEHKTEEYLKINPFGRVPALVDGDLALSESGAILNYLAERLGGLTTIEARAVALKWSFFAQTTLYEAIHDQRNLGHLPGVLAGLEKSLEGKDYLAGTFSVSDVAVGSCLAWSKSALGDKFDLSPYPAVSQYVGRISSRSAFQAAFAAMSQ